MNNTLGLYSSQISLKPPCKGLGGIIPIRIPHQDNFGHHLVGPVQVRGLHNHHPGALELLQHRIRAGRAAMSRSGARDRMPSADKRLT